MNDEDFAPGASAARWFCVQTKPRAEAEAAAQLARQNFTVFLPRLRSVRLRQSRRVAVVEPLFPRYLFLHADPGFQSLASVRSTRGACGLVRVGGHPAVVADALIAQLRARSDPDDCIDDLRQQLVHGDRVRIVAGPLAGLDAVFAARDGLHRATILLDLLGRPQTVTVPEHTLFKLVDRAA